MALERISGDATEAKLWIIWQDIKNKPWPGINIYDNKKHKWRFVSKTGNPNKPVFKI